MKGPRTTTYLLIAGLLTMMGTLVWTGCGSDESATKGTGVLSGTQPFVASSMVNKEAEGTSTEVGDITQVRGATVEYAIEATDPRVAGTFAVTYNMDQIADGSGKMWGTWVDTNTDGTWVSDTWTGYHAANVDTFVFGQSKGTGKYEGLVSYWLWHWNTTYASSFQGNTPAIAASGWIGKGD